MVRQAPGWQRQNNGARQELPVSINSEDLARIVVLFCLNTWYAKFAARSDHTTQMYWTSRKTYFKTRRFAATPLSYFRWVDRFVGLTLSLQSLTSVSASISARAPLRSVSSSFPQPRLALLPAHGHARHVHHAIYGMQQRWSVLGTKLSMNGPGVEHC